MQIQIEHGIPIPPPLYHTRGRRPRREGACKCGRATRPGYKTCDLHLEYAKTERTKRTSAGLCATGGCPERPKAGHTLCPAHLKDMLTRNTQMRNDRKSRGMCMACDERPGWFGVYCAFCRINLHHVAPNSLPLGAKRALKQYRRFEAIDERRARAEKIVGMLPTDRARQVIRLRHGLDDGVDHTLEEIGAKLGVTRERIRQIEARALAELEHVGIDVSLVRPPFKALQRKPKRSIRRLDGDERKKQAARGAVTEAVRAGTLVRQPCEKCGAVKSIAHHKDYDKPLDVEWLCPRHHLQAHGRGNGEPKPKKISWIDKLKPTAESYDAPALIASIKAASYKPKIKTIIEETGLRYDTVREVLSGKARKDSSLLAVLRYVESLNPPAR